MPDETRSTKPALDPMKPGSTGPAVPGIYPVIWDEEGNEVPRARAALLLTIYSLAIGCHSKLVKMGG
jgi:acyl-coenzyme A synthetase/AMP-(fatty) acid ligase